MTFHMSVKGYLRLIINIWIRWIIIIIYPYPTKYTYRYPCQHRSAHCTCWPAATEIYHSPPLYYFMEALSLKHFFCCACDIQYRANMPGICTVQPILISCHIEDLSLSLYLYHVHDTSTHVICRHCFMTLWLSKQQAVCWLITINPCHAEMTLENKKFIFDTYNFSTLRLLTKILPCERQGSVFCAKSRSWLSMRFWQGTRTSTNMDGINPIIPASAPEVMQHLSMSAEWVCRKFG